MMKVIAAISGIIVIVSKIHRHDSYDINDASSIYDVADLIGHNILTTVIEVTSIVITVHNCCKTYK